ncbi:uncharacterized protein LOC126743346 isoform X2 [Anthonomus grandis grandis]|uniref:uncharacterized protein LOC126743346 isoform X2 n=1 Tax=Anthonomus grandis grandis TaxID=2921223 RepID=UPI002165B8A1|nr:uncharacterized protein LOC126743346 isoform X2 [Anthonomus grandis grandis]
MVVICRLCLKSLDAITTDYFDILFGDDRGLAPYNYLEKVIPELYLSLTEAPILCKECYDQTKKFYYFKQSCLKTDQLIRIFMRHFRSSGKVNLENVISYWKTQYQKNQIPFKVDQVMLEKILGLGAEKQPVAEDENNFKGLTVNLDMEELKEKELTEQIKRELLGNSKFKRLTDALDSYIMGRVINYSFKSTYALIRKSTHKDMKEAIRKTGDKHLINQENNLKLFDLILIEQDPICGLKIINLAKPLPVRVLRRKSNVFTVSSEPKERPREDYSGICYMLSEKTHPLPKAQIRVKPVTTLQEPKSVSLETPQTSCPRSKLDKGLPKNAKQSKTTLPSTTNQRDNEVPLNIFTRNESSNVVGNVTVQNSSDLAPNNPEETLDNPRNPSENTESVMDIYPGSPQTEDDGGGDHFSEQPEVNQPRSKTNQNKAKTAEKTVDIRSFRRKSAKQIRRDAKKASSIDEWPQDVNYFESPLHRDVLLLFANFNVDGDYINDHDYFRSPYGTTQMVENQFCVCMLCGKRQLAWTHVKHMKTHETSCRLCGEQFENVYRLNLHAYSHFYYCVVCKTTVFYHSYFYHAKIHSTSYLKPINRLQMNKNAKKTENKRPTLEPNCVLKLLEDHSETANEKRANSAVSPASSSTESATSESSEHQRLTLSDLLNEPVTSTPPEMILLTEEETEELCSGKTAKHRYAETPLKSVKDVLADIRRQAVVDDVRLRGRPKQENPKETVKKSNKTRLKRQPKRRKRKNKDSLDAYVIKKPKRYVKKSKKSETASPHGDVSQSKRSKNKEISSENFAAAPSTSCEKLTPPENELRPEMVDPGLHRSKVTSEAQNPVKTSATESFSLGEQSDVPIGSKTPGILGRKSGTCKKSVFRPEMNQTTDSNDIIANFAPEVDESEAENLNKPSLKNPIEGESNVPVRPKSRTRKKSMSTEEHLNEPKQKKRRKSTFEPDETCVAEKPKMCRKNIIAPDLTALERKCDDLPSILSSVKSRRRRNSIYQKPRSDLKEPEKRLVVILEKVPCLETLQLAYMVEQLKERSLQAIEFQKMRNMSEREGQ